VCGACCNRAEVGGGCTDGVPRQGCTGEPGQVSHYPDETCAEVEARGDCAEHTGACCDESTFGGCQVHAESDCDCKKCVFYKDMPCEEIVCLHNPIPTMSQWGLAVLTLLLLIGAKVYFGRRPVEAA
ncbi:MAG: IPTL-CTERM sorting domain-containing protein, partial [Planctomycetota bacterium]